MSRKGRRIASWSLLACVIVTTVTAVAFRRQVEEVWHLFRLRSEDAAVRGQALSRLEQIGGDRSVTHLARVLLEDSSESVRGSSARVLGAIFPRLTQRHREQSAAVLREAALAENERAAVVLRKVGPQCPWIYPLLADDIISQRGTEFVAAAILFEGWPVSRKEIARVASRVSASVLLDLVGRLVEGDLLQSLLSEEMEQACKPVPRSGLVAPGRFLALEHGDPLVRTIGISLGVLQAATAPDIDFDLLRAVFEKDPHRVPRRAALRIEGYLGPHEGSLDLDRIIREERDAELRVTAIQARDLWSTGLHDESTGIELWEGAAIIGLERGLFPPHPEPWTEAEIKSLEAILMSENDPDLRDAASLALAGRHRRFIETPEFAGEPLKAPDFAVHEWGVWREGGGILASTKVIDELPWFVHRSFSQVEEILDPRAHRSFKVQGVVMKPVIFFHGRNPATAFLRIDFPEGRPWTFYPEITDYTAGGSGRGSSWKGILSVHPPWLRTEREAAEEGDGLLRAKGSDELDSRRSVAPWVVGTRYRLPGSWNGVGLEWCGLRVGYPVELETQLEPAEETPWWTFLRDVPSTSVALRSDRERFVFYDGAVTAPSPLRIAWENALRQGLLLRADASHLPAVLIIEKSARGLRGGMLKGMSWSDCDSTLALTDLDLEGDGLVSAFDGALRGAGLTPGEATSLVRTWTPEFFEAEGLRVITLLPRWMYDSMLPLRIAPVPGEIVRVGLVWRECDDLGIGF